MTRTTTLRAVAALLAITAIASAEEPRGTTSTSQPTTGQTTPPTQPKQPASPHAGMSANGAAVYVNARDLKWTAAPPVLPKGAEMAVLFGDPMKPDVFTMRLRVPDGYKIPPHWHTQNEHLTILAGNFELHMGDSYASPPHVLEPGGYHFLPGGMHHAAVARGETIIQINGHGPFDIQYVNPADNPLSRSAKR